MTSHPYFSHGIYRAGTQLMWQIVALDEANPVLALVKRGLR